MVFTIAAFPASSVGAIFLVKEVAREVERDHAGDHTDRLALRDQYIVFSCPASMPAGSSLRRDVSPVRKML